jgi:actin related protein 2/3 complex subunit 5
MADLDTLLATAPAGSKDLGAKAAHADQVFAALDKIADSKIDVTIEAMTPDAGDVLLKYVYRGLETPSERTASLFKWQAKLSEKFGVGAIVRVLSDRKTV